MNLLQRLLFRDAQIGVGAHVTGRPHIASRGTLVIGDDFVFHSRPVRSHLIVGPGAKLVIGDGVAVEHGCAVSCFAEITLGDGVCIGPFSSLLDHNFHEIGDRAAPGTPRPIHIGKGARLGARVTVLRGVSIGEGAFIEAGSTVARAVPPGVRAGGVPARVLGDRHSPHRTPAGDLGELVPRAVMVVLRLAEPPQITAARSLFPQWDALAGARIAAVLEGEIGRDLPREAIARAASVAEIMDRIAHTL